MEWSVIRAGIFLYLCVRERAAVLQMQLWPLKRGGMYRLQKSPHEEMTLS